MAKARLPSISCERGHIKMQTPAPGKVVPNKLRKSDASVLVVDDHVDIADAVALMLAPHVGEVRVAYDGPTAIALAVSRAPDLVIADLAMPEMDGFELVAKLHALPQLEGSYFLALTAFDPAKYRAATRIAGFDEHLVKPITEQQLLEVLAAMSRAE